MSTDIDAFPGQLARTQGFTLGVPRAFTLSPDGRRLLFLRTRGPEDRTSCLWLLDEAAERLLVDPDTLGQADGQTDSQAGGQVPEAELVRRERTRERSTGIVAYSADKAARVVVFALNGELWTVDVGSGQARRVPTAGPVVDPRVDPAGRHVAYVSDGDLRVTSLTEGADAAAETGGGRLLSDPADSADPWVTWGLPEHAASESMYRYRGYWWSPDGTRVLAARVDETAVARWWIGDPADPARPPREVAYPVAGTANAVVSLHVLGLDGTRVDVAWDRSAFEYLPAAGWDTHGPLISVQSRDQRTLRVLAVDPGTGTTELLHEQRDAAWVELIVGTPARTAADRLVHTEDRGGTRHLIVDDDAVTPEGLQIREVVAVDGESVLFVASDEPTEEHLWRYQDGSPRRLSDGPGKHTGQLAGDVLLLNSFTDDGHAVRLIRPDTKDTPVRCLDAAPVLPPRITWLRAGEHEIRTALLLPSWYQPGEQRLPVLVSPYGGPAAQLAVHTRHIWFCEAQWFAESGFAVVIADGRGTPGRGPVWEKTIHLDKLSVPLEDQVVALRATAEHCPDLDLERVAIRGWSYGGTLAAAAVLRRPDVFHAAIAGAPAIDQRLYDTHWSERFLGHPEQEPKAYDRSSLLLDAPALRRPLLLVHGMADDNVVPAHTLRMSAALLTAGRPHQVLPLSGTTHMPTTEEGMAGLLRHELAFFRAALGLPDGARLPSAGPARPDRRPLRLPPAQPPGMQEASGRQPDAADRQRESRGGEHAG
ncbi:MAG TPA: prolyl oligopeptidase family serine peptidase [Streptosporangiaceae bacterium]|nr:prolyl oligopeptidase family serine peptidase [Streptosporangiaceae bacterium]